MVTTPPQTTNTTTLTTSTSTIGGNVPISTTAPTSLRVARHVKVATEDLSVATPEEEAGIRKKNKELLLNQFKIGLRKDLMKETGVLLLREEHLDLEKAENLVKLQETTLLMMQGRMSNMKISTVETESFYTVGKPGHLQRMS
ncbi:hypothetical protein JTB14_011506 [Gonioctena quinquepunctata]|nr:hypothetical protein JTB14_011506 [Gonioctena quinquepunctata]